MSVHTLSTTTPYPIESTVSSPIPCHLHHVAEHEDRGLPTEKELSSSYPGAIKPVQLLQLQRRHVPHPAQGCEEESLFYNCTTPKHKVPPAPLHHTLELHDQTSLLSAAAPSHIHTQGGGWYNRKGGGLVDNWRQGQVVHPDSHRRHQGRVKWYNQQKKYGFIISRDSKEYFVHRDDLKPINPILEPHLYTGEYVEYDPIPTEDGRLKASNVSGIE